VLAFSLQCFSRKAEDVMKHVLQHRLDLATSKQIADQAFAQYQKRLAKYEPTMCWLDDQHAEVQFEVKGIAMTGSVELRPGSVEIDLDVPFLFRPFRGIAIRVLEEELRMLIAEHSPSVRTAAPPAPEPWHPRHE
jgi:hypothetical protein